MSAVLAFGLFISSTSCRRSLALIERQTNEQISSKVCTQIICLLGQTTVPTHKKLLQLKLSVFSVTFFCAETDSLS